MAQATMAIWKDSFALGNKPAKWTYDMGVVLKGIEAQWLNTGNGDYFKYIQKQADFFVDDKGNIKTYKPDEFNIDNINNGRVLLMLYKVTQKEKYLKAVQKLREQLLHHPRTAEGGFWHKQIYPHQMWLDGLYMAEPFYAEYADMAHEDSSFDDIANQFILAEKHLRNPVTGLLYHGWDESKTEKWASQINGCSPHAWARAMGWYASALVDVLDFFPENHPKRIELIAIANRLAVAIQNYQNANTGLWYDVLGYDGPGKERNYFEASASSQFVYFLAKTSRKKYLKSSALVAAIRGFDGILKEFVHVDSGVYRLSGTVKVSGLGNKPYRDGSFDYYMSEPVIDNDPKGLGVFLMAASEIEMNVKVVDVNDAETKAGLGPKNGLVLMDNYFNRENHTDAFGNNVVFHYKWWERDNGGYSFVDHIIHQLGGSTALLDGPPTKKSLKNAAVYVLIDPDWPKENKKPNYIQAQDIKAICNYVKKGGVLLLMANDSNNVEFEHFNQLAQNFGFKWNINVRHDVKNDHFEEGVVDLSQMPEIFGNTGKGYIKQLCTQTLITTPQNDVDIKAVYKENGEILMTVAHYGKGTVFAVGDPWFYNEYVDGRKLPPTYKNYEAAKALFSWLLNASKK
jgi:unsaturated rhamnogalacturonyl hydrolase